MARPYRESRVLEAVVATSLSTLWDWFEDRRAQVGYGTRITDIVVLEGEWASAGCRARVDYLTPRGEAATFESETLSHERPASYTFRVLLPDVVVTTIHRTSEVEGGVLYRQESTIETRPTAFWVRWMLVMTRAKRDRDVRATHAQDIKDIEAYLASAR